MNGIQTIVLIGGMMLLLGLSGELLFGEGAFLWTAAMVGLVLVFAPKVSPRMVMHLYHARPLSLLEAPQLIGLLRRLSERAGLVRAPTLYLVPSSVMNAFTVGSRDEAAVAVTDALLHRLGPRELAGVLAHELSHVVHNDMWVMGLADSVSRLTANLSLLGQFLIVMNLPMLLLAQATISWFGLLLLVFAPMLSTLLQLALSRTREYDADLSAARITGDPRGLASALEKLERYGCGWVERIFFPEGRSPSPSFLRTHPPTQERIRRLLALGELDIPPALVGDAISVTTPDLVTTTRPARRRWSGLWY